MKQQAISKEARKLIQEAKSDDPTARRAYCLQLQQFMVSFFGGLYPKKS